MKKTRSQRRRVFCIFVVLVRTCRPQGRAIAPRYLARDRLPETLRRGCEPDRLQGRCIITVNYAVTLKPRAAASHKA